MTGLLNFGGLGRRHHRQNATAVRDASFVILDTELTGLNERKDSIVSVGAVRMSGTRISLGDPFYRLVRPRTALTRESVIIHGIMPSDVAEEQDIASVLAQFMDFCGGAVIVGHCVGIDLAFIERELKHVLGRRLAVPVLDTAELFAWMSCRGLLRRCIKDAPEQPDLYKLARCLDIAIAESHHAMVDAFITAQVFQRFLSLLEQERIMTVGDLVRIGDPHGGGDRFRSSGEIGNL
jgi:DNA polymerase-3 subunit epsilon